VQRMGWLLAEWFAVLQRSPLAGLAVAAHCVFPFSSSHADLFALFGQIMCQMIYDEKMHFCLRNLTFIINRK
jgi:hypothetical protein